jgi:hypothetical protein
MPLLKFTLLTFLSRFHVSVWVMVFLGTVQGTGAHECQTRVCNSKLLLVCSGIVFGIKGTAKSNCHILTSYVLAYIKEYTVLMPQYALCCILVTKDLGNIGVCFLARTFGGVEDHLRLPNFPHFSNFLLVPGALRTGPHLSLATATKADKPQARRGRVHATRERARHVTGRRAAGLVPARGSSLNAGPHLDRGPARRTARQRQCRARSASSLTTAAGRR